MRRWAVETESNRFSRGRAKNRIKGRLLLKV